MGSLGTAVILSNEYGQCLQAVNNKLIVNGFRLTAYRHCPYK